MEYLTKTDRKTLLQASPWKQAVEPASHRIVEQTVEGRARYCRWATEAAKFYKGKKPVRFVGEHWKL